MTEPLNVASCGECFESWSEPAEMPREIPLAEVEIHTENTGHRYDIQAQEIE